jgi:hypothetical protein
MSPRRHVHVRQNVDWFETPLPDELWQALERKGLIS